MEVEVKARVSNISLIEKNIISQGAIFRNEVIEEDEYFNHPCLNFGDTDEALRLRNGKELTYKGPKVDNDTKSREEIEVRVDDAEKMRNILLTLGFKFVTKVKKSRKYYSFNGTTICIDHVFELGYFVEIECIGSYEPCKKKVMETVNKLNLKTLERRSYLELILHQRRTK